MSAPNAIAVDKLSRLVGTPGCPVLIDVRSAEDYAADPRSLPATQHRSHTDAADWAPQFAGQTVVVICQAGRKLSEGTAALLRHAGASAQSLDGGFAAWAAAGLPLIADRLLPQRDGRGRTHWVTRARPKVDRIACPWLIRRFVDPQAVILYVAAPEVQAVAERFAAAPFDIENTFWSHRGDACTFDTMLTELGLETEPLLRLATIVRGADTARPDLAPEAPGLLALSLGLSRMYADDLAQLAAGLGLYDALYRWCRDATDETHKWPSNKVRP